MSIAINFSVSDLILSAEQAASAELGVLDAEQVYFQFICQTTDGGHDPDGVPDDKVRPTHAALHGTVWRIDDPYAPIPPIDWGCRCAGRHVGKPESLAEKVFNAAAKTEPQPIGLHFGNWLDKAVPNWQRALDATKKVHPIDREGAVYLWLKENAPAYASHDVSKMILSAIP